MSEVSEGRFDSPSLTLKRSTDAHWSFLEMAIFIIDVEFFEQERHGGVFKPRWGPSGKRLSQGHRVS